MTAKLPFYVTTPIYYVNDEPHIGHTYTTIVADVVARFRRMRGFDVRFLTGTDEHGINIQRAAERQGLRPIELADRVVARYHDLWKRLDIRHDDFIRTTEPRHRAAVERLFRKVREAGDIYEGAYSGWYCASCEAFYPEGQLVERRCPTHEKPTEWLEEPSLFFRLSRYQEPLLALYERSPDFILPESRRNEVVSFVRSGLKDLSVSRTALKWGIPVPDTPGHVIYVWFDALTNYISALGYGAGEAPLYERYWRGRGEGEPEAAPALHLVGKDILRFHAVYWPAFLMAAGEPLPRTVWAHGWWLNDERKMSKTVGNVVRPGPLLEVFGPEGLRYFLMREMTFGLDGTYSDDAVAERLNADLANNLGNLLSRVTTLLQQRRDGELPAAEAAGVAEIAAPVREALDGAGRSYLEAFDRCDFSAGLSAVWQALDAVNRFLVERQPWAASGAATADQTLRAAAEALYLAGAWISPVCPGLGREIWRRLGLDEDPGRDGRFADLSWRGLPAGRVRPGPPLLARIDRPAALERLESLRREEAGRGAPAAGKAPGAAGGEPSKSDREDTMTEDRKAGGPITIDQFMGVELLAGRVESAERVPKADRLLKLVVDIGTGKRQIVAGIAESYAPEDLVGRQVIVVANLQPAVLRGVESQGMLLAADAGGRTMIATFDAPVPPGTRVR